MRFGHLNIYMLFRYCHAKKNFLKNKLSISDMIMAVFGDKKKY